MRIGGLVRSSMVDYPGCVAAVVFTQGCDFRCPFCHNPDLANPLPDDAAVLEESGVLDFLYRRRGLLDGVVLTGGEPTLQDGLLPFLRKVKGYGYRVKLDTNGSRPAVLSEVIEEGLVDFLAMDVKAPLSKYSQLCGVEVSPDQIRVSIQIIRQAGIPHEFRTTAVRPLHTIEDLVAVGETVGGCDRFVLQRFINGRLLDPTFARTAQPFAESDLESVQSTLQSRSINCIIR